MKMRWPRSKKHLDEDKIKMREQLRNDMNALLFTGDEVGFVELIKELNPKITPEELVSLIQRFRQDRRNL